MSLESSFSRPLVPPFIHEKWAQGQTRGQQAGTALFADIAGFTHITETLLGHDQEAAETLATLMAEILTPLIKIVAAHQGFVTHFAGDAITALFANGVDAFTAAQQMQQYLRQKQPFTTPYHQFNIELKIGLGTGKIDWGIVASTTEAMGAVYYFSGEAITQAAAAQKMALPTQLLLDRASYHQLLGVLTAVPRGDYWEVDLITGPLNFAPPAPSPPVAEAVVSPFIPQAVREQKESGAYRQVYSLFINLLPLITHEQLVALLLVVFDAQQAYGGYLSGVHYDDKGWHLILFWGMPLSYENDGEQLLRFILALQAESDLEMRMGVTYRLMYAGFLGAPGWREAYSCYGRGVNLAARLMVTAVWGTILLDAFAAQQLSRYGELLPQGKQLFKGFEHKQPIYQLLGWRDEVGSLFTEVFVGRQEELKQVQAFVAPIAQGVWVGTLVVQGAAGMGKSRLLHAFRQEMLFACQLFAVQAEQVLHPHALNPWRSFLHDYFEQSSQQDITTNQQIFLHKFYQLVTHTADSGLRQTLLETESYLAALLNLPTAGTVYNDSDGQTRYERVMAGIQALLGAEAHRVPVILQVEDAHWLDKGSWAVLAQLQSVPATTPLAIVLTSRPDETVTAFVREHDGTVIDLSPLSEASLAGLATRILDVPPEPDLLKIVVQRSQGNPFFAEQMLFYLYQLGGITSARELRRTTTLLPLDVRAPLIARLDRLAAPVKVVVQSAAILGREFDISILLNMFPQDPQLHAKVREAEAASIWAPRDHIHYRFTHDLLRDAAYEMQLKTRRQDIHQRAATAIETIYEAHLAPHYAQLGYHYEKAERLVKACFYWEQAGHSAQEAYQNKEALAHYERLLLLISRLMAEEGTRTATFEWKKIDVLQRQGTVLRHIGQAHRAEGVYEEALALAQKYADVTQQATIHTEMGYLLIQFGRKDEALGHYQAAVAFYEGQKNLLGQAQVQSRLGVLYAEQGDYPQAIDYFELSWKLAYQQEDHDLVAKNLNNLALIYQRQGNYEGALDYFRQGLQIKRVLGDEDTLARTLSNIAIVYAELGDYERAVTHLEEALTLDRKLGRRSGIAKRLHNMGFLYQLEGMYPQALAAYQEALQINRALGYERSLGRNLAWIGNLYNIQGQYEVALSYLVQGLKVLREVNDTYGLAHCLLALARVHFEQRHFKDAQQLLAEGMGLAAKTGLADIVFEGTILRAYMHAYQGDEAAAVGSLRHCLEGAKERVKQAAVLFALWEIMREEVYRQEAQALYQLLVNKTANAEYRKRLQRLTEG